MAFSLDSGRCNGPVQDHEEGELALMDCVPPFLVADDVRSPEKDAIDFWNQSIQSSRQHPPTSCDTYKPISQHVATAGDFVKRRQSVAKRWGVFLGISRLSARRRAAFQWRPDRPRSSAPELSYSGTS
jgi:hypothetical protein